MLTEVSFQGGRARGFFSGLAAHSMLPLEQSPSGAFGLALGIAASYIWARQHDDNPLWHAGGVLYIGLPSMALVALRVFPLQPALIVLGLFLIVWATDTGALVFGKLIGGPKIAPRLSPGKTWAGTIGGSITATIVGDASGVERYEA